MKVQYLMTLLFDLFEILRAVRSEQTNFAGSGQRPGGGPGGEAPGSSEDTSFYSTKMCLKLMHFCRGIVVEIIRIGRQKISQKITFIFYTNEGVRNP